jgi:hypothetical protein
MARTTVVFPDPLPPATPSMIGRISSFHFSGEDARERCHEQGAPGVRRGDAGRRVKGLAGGVSRLGLLVLAVAAVWDVAGALRLPPEWWPQASHAMVGAGVAIVCVAVFLRVMQRRRGVPGDTRATALELAGAGLFLGAWLLRGHREIPPDPPLVVGQVTGFMLIALAAWWRRRRDG